TVPTRSSCHSVSISIGRLRGMLFSEWFEWNTKNDSSRASGRPMRAAITALFLLLSLTGSASALAQASVFLDSLTSPELQAAVAGGTTTVIVPIGGTEQNGPHTAPGKPNPPGK